MGDYNPLFTLELEKTVSSLDLVDTPLEGYGSPEHETSPKSCMKDNNALTELQGKH